MSGRDASVPLYQGYQKRLTSLAEQGLRKNCAAPIITPDEK
jgi:hypothetical protein